MAEQVHLLLHSGQEPGTPQASWIHVQNGAPASTLKMGDLAQAYDDIGDLPLAVYVSGLDVLLARTPLPGGRRSQLRNALPYALEDSLVDDIDTLHCALGSAIDENHYYTAVVSRDLMEQWHTQLLDAGLHPKHIIPDTLLLPWSADEWTLHCDADIVRVRTGAADGFVCGPDALPTLLQYSLTQDQTPRPSRLRVYNCALPDMPAWPDDIELQEQDTQNRRLDDLLQGPYDAEYAINLLQGPYAPASRIRKQLKPWYSAAALAAVLVLLGITNNVMEYVSLSRQSQQLQEQMTQIFRQAFPQAKKVADPYKRLQSELKKVQGGGEEHLFREMLVQIAPVAKGTQGINIKNLRYHQGQMELLVELPDLESLEAFKQSLTSNTSWEVTLRSANASEDKVLGRLLIARPS